MENLTDFEAGRLTGVYHTLAILETVVEEMTPKDDTITAHAITAILQEVLTRVKDQAKT